MNRTKRKIFETALKLFAEKGYDATSVEEITSVVGVAKGTLYYHFSSKEEIFNFLIEEGMKLLYNSIEIKLAKQNTYLGKLKAIILIQIKVLVQYEHLATILFSQIWGNDSRNIVLRNHVYNYMKEIENIITKGIQSKEFKECNPELMATQIFCLICSSLIYKLKTKQEINIPEMFKEYEKTLFNGLIVE